MYHATHDTSRIARLRGSLALVARAILVRIFIKIYKILVKMAGSKASRCFAKFNFAYRLCRKFSVNFTGLKNFLGENFEPSPKIFWQNFRKIILNNFFEKRV